MKNYQLIPHSPRSYGNIANDSETYTIEHPNSNIDLLRKIAEDNQYILAMCGGVARLVPPDKENQAKKLYNSYYPIDSDKPIRKGGINYVHLINEMCNGNIKAMSFAHLSCLSGRIDQKILKNKINSILIDDEPPVAIYVDQGKGQDMLHSHTMGMIKSEDKTWATPYHEDVDSYSDYLVNELEPFMNDLFFNSNEDGQ